ncbi:MAG: ATP-dependent protease [Burkholderiales bacterium]|jgi:magnesium chelatase family protein|nr:ATP-dependent protease [Burkholderiales bacterium]
MSLAKLYSRAIRGMQAPEVIVEVHVTGGLPSFSIVGLPDTEVKESRDRVRSAISMSGYNFPARRITVNLAPADLPKESGRYDLPIALGVLIASGLIQPELDYSQFEFAGELALDGTLRKIHGALAMACTAKESKRGFILPIDNAVEASYVDNLAVYKAKCLNEVVAHLCSQNNLALEIKDQLPENWLSSLNLDFNQVKGQLSVKTALEVAAAGRHSLLMIGNPGCGKSMLSERLITILPGLTNSQALETASIHSLTRHDTYLSNWGKIPFRNPHHSSSAVAIVGGGSNPKPGEISLAHNGILFMDEIPEFDRKVLEVLREPLETKKVSISRANYKVEYPADFQLIAAMNPCPCGNRGHPQNLCKCSVEQVARYQSKISAPLLDRIDLVVQMPHLNPEDLHLMPQGECSETIRGRVLKARELQLNRQNKLNYALNNDEIELFCLIEPKAQDLLKTASTRLGLSARSYYRVLKVSRSIADLAGSEVISMPHIAQSIQYRDIL